MLLPRRLVYVSFLALSMVGKRGGARLEIALTAEFGAHSQAAVCLVSRLALSAQKQHGNVREHSRMDRPSVQQEKTRQRERSNSPKDSTSFFKPPG